MRQRTPPRPVIQAAVLAPAAVIAAAPGGPLRTAVGATASGDPDGAGALPDPLVGQVVVVMPASAGLLVRNLAAPAAGTAALSWNVVVEVVLVICAQVTHPA